ncbi:uncharacterized protein KIAA1143 homolog [Physella acuta]|uniref:uncharacterized protein KIAA1143 homolog n=1 Tax=Physella acuta TaxID=109671 RepID=UPI0027DC3053|nr:uncharacterized protein KIAA1143 homolog [Physella acuta]
MPRQGVSYVKNEEPSFIKQFKEKIGHKDEPDVNTKKLSIPNFDEDDDEDVPEKEEEKPVVVVLKSGDLTAEEAELEKKQIDEGPARLDEKITFKKPSKRTQDTTENTDKEESSKKRKETEVKKTFTAKKTKNSSLLSFGDDEGDDS